MLNEQSTTRSKYSPWLERFLIKDIRLSMLLFFGLIVAANFLFGDGRGYRPNAIFWGALLVSHLPWLAYLLTQCFPCRFSVKGILFATTIIAIYSYALKNSWHLFTLKNSQLIMGFSLGCPLLGLCSAILVEHFLFRRGWRPHRASHFNFKGEGLSLVRPFYIWPFHIVTAIFSASMILVGGATTASTGSDLLVGVGCALALFFHIQSIVITEVKWYEQGVRILGRSWLWKDGSLQLFEVEEGTRLGPVWLKSEKPWKQKLWPIVPEDRVEDIQRLLDKKQSKIDTKRVKMGNDLAN